MTDLLFTLNSKSTLNAITFNPFWAKEHAGSAYCDLKSETKEIVAPLENLLHPLEWKSITFTKLHVAASSVKIFPFYSKLILPLFRPFK